MRGAGEQFLAHGDDLRGRFDADSDRLAVNRRHGDGDAQIGEHNLLGRSARED
jgi:hypothetical protein